ncbi:uncharacterized protein BO97DRAFT_445546 [Aspergillus homomorphus CBS 101889]|uniref:BTB domain-containing protein n=1 Tax=Aspergillus homomorphus (strain CBS 101889) TaxID=1450537 RepID=A0A395HP37_ASPHC|nr:hypothetical protein BO97DRAFT_445546 [Aspergillus homomorphus CBS 101889]RAL09249.1 hypothetical protein BO97DRAFT_445546 [Aspergillus homomorphus CBS 101889]
MEADKDFSSIVHSPPFTFLVGPNHTKLTIQAGLARHVSQPLDHLMNSGETRESKHHIAVLEDEDVETFVAFCEYAYTGDYRVPPPGSREEDRDNQRVSNPFRGVFSKDSPTSPVRTIPPRAPTPPRTSSRETHDRPSEGMYAGSGRDDDDWECAIAPDEEPANFEQELRPGLEKPSEQPATTLAVDEKGDEDAWDAADDEAIKGKQGKKNKTNKNKKKGASGQEQPSSKLTPPSTPPPENPKPEEDVANATAETRAVSEHWGQESAPVEAPSAAEPASHTESWEQTTVAPPAEAETNDADSGGAKSTSQAPKEEKHLEHDRGGRRLTGPMIDTSFAKQQYSRLHEKGTSLWDEFAAIDYIDPRSCLSTRPPSVISSRSPYELPYLVFHAKLYVFATRYLIPALAQLCLRKLHRDLLYLGFPETMDDDEEHHALTSIKALKVLDLLHYTYTKTTRLEPITPTSATQLRDNELRKLVVHYAACKVRDLATYCPPVDSDLGSPSAKSHKPSAQGLRALLDTTTELASDLVYRMMV